ncbi:MAG: type II toxin-antitoxin system VapC family toxin [Crocosphaera sp.]|nr:type II toxin-antitoxin system VapC family toxin [Crocosphaera sp.]
MQWLDDQEETNLFVSILTIAELKKGIIKIEKRQPLRHQKLIKWLEIIEQRFKNRILPLTNDILMTWAKISGESEAKGTKLPIMDSLILATAYEHQLVIVTRNISDFTSSEVQVFSPWEL